MKGRTLVVGDIHGAYKALVQLLEKLQLKQHDKLIFVGDYVDGWPESSSVIELLIALSEKYACVFIKGNHDIWCGSWLEGNEPEEAWLESNGMSTILSYGQMDKQQKAKHLDFFAALNNYYIDDENRLFVHAGFTSVKGPEEEVFLYNLHNDRTLLETALAMDKSITSDSVFYPKRLALFSEIFIGHTPTTKYNLETPLNGGNLWDIDTGAGKGGRISAMDIVTKEFWQSDEVKDLYPD